LKEQEITEGKECDRQTNLSTQGSETQPALERNPIQGNISESKQGLVKSLRLYIRTTPTPDEPQIMMSYAATITTTSTAQGHSRTTPFSTVGMTGGTLAWPTDSRGDQIMQEGRNSRMGSTDLGQAAPN
jgi:hypothetical protein